MAGKFPFGRSRAGDRNEICIVPPKGEPELPSRPAKIQSEVGACLQAIHNAAGRRRENRLQAGSCKRPSFFSSMNAARNRREGCSRESKAENTLPGIPADPQIDRRWTHPFGFPPISHLSPPPPASHPHFSRSGHGDLCRTQPVVLLLQTGDLKDAVRVLPALFRQPVNGAAQ